MTTTVAKITVTTLLLLSCLLANSAWSWGPLGHRVVCDVAWRASDSETKARLAASATRMGYKTFATACLWPDHIRSKKNYDHLKPLHYMNVPRGLSELTKNPCKDTRLKKPRCVLSAITYYKQRWGDNRLSVRQRDQALLFMSHFIGDIHQPLHVSFSDDRGGTLKRVIFKGKLISLHRLWDSNILSCNGNIDWSTLGGQLYRKLEGQQATQSSPLLWAQESYKITQKIYQNTRSRLSQSYCSQFNAIAVDRLARAGLRLSFMLSTAR